MDLKDGYDNAISTGVRSTRDHYVDGVAKFLAGAVGAYESFSAAIADDPEFALGHAGLARAAMMNNDMAGAKASIARAEALKPGADARERAHIDALSLLLSGQAPAARAAVQAHVRTYPRDALAAQLCCSIYGLIGFSGNIGREAELLAYTGALLPHYEGDWWMMSMHALSLCETGQYDRSLALMEDALAINPRNAHGAHFKSHALYELGETGAGRTYLDAWLNDYDSRGSLHGHLSWHSALWALQDGDTDAMWASVDAGIAPGAAKGLPLNIVTDTAAILYRAEVAGHEVAPKRWAALSNYAAQFFPEPGQSFADMHAALAHAMAGEGERLAKIAETTKGFAGDLIRPVARGWAAIARADWQGALDELTGVLGENVRIGGSRAQRDLLELAYVNVLLKLGLAEEARRYLVTRRPILASAPPVSGFH